MANPEECIQNPGSPPFSPQETPPGSPAKLLTHGGTIQKINQENEKGWAYFESDDGQGLITEEAKGWMHFPENLKATDTSSISSEAESLDDVWTITDEQRDYYIAQFKTMQSETHGVITGAVAKDFFEKSKLPVQELSKIWQLSDVNRDGALSLPEFCTAMHLVVLRRNEIELPNHLPPSLMPYIPLSDEPFAADLPPGSTLKRLSPSSPSQWQQAFPGTDSPTSSSVSSPGSKPTPLSFEFKPVTADIDTKIIHPVALRVSPDAQVIGSEEWMKLPADVVPYEAEQPSGDSEGSENQNRPGMFTDTLIDPHVPVPLHSRPRPTPKKAQSCDLQSLQLKPPPAVPPRPSPKEEEELTVVKEDSTQGNFADFSQFGETPHSQDTTDFTRSVHDDDEELIVDYLNHNRGRLSQYIAKHTARDMKLLKVEIRKKKEDNTMLSRVNSELNQELQEVMEQRIALEIQLEHLRPFSY